MQHARAHHATRLTQTLLPSSVSPSPPRTTCSERRSAHRTFLYPIHPGLDGGRTTDAEEEEEKSLVQHRRKELCQQRPREGGGQRAGGQTRTDGRGRRAKWFPSNPEKETNR